MKANRVSLEQWRALLAVVDQRGYAPAAEFLHKSQSAISYAIRTLEQGLGVRVFTIQGRRAELTASGRILYQRARLLLQEAGHVEALAGRLAQGWAASVRLAVEAILPLSLVFEALARFHEASDTTRIELIESVLSGTQEALIGGQVDLAVTGLVPAGFVGSPLCEVRFMAVAHPDHPLHHQGNDLLLRDLTAHRQLVVRDSGSEARDAGWLRSEQRWTVSTLAASIEAVRRGLGFAWLPVGHIQPLLDRGELKPLPLSSGGLRSAHLQLVYVDPDHAGPAASRLGELLCEVCRAPNR